jgi:hypothetical protein
VKGLRGRNEARVGIYDARGRRIGELTVGLADGRGEQHWNGLDNSGHSVPSGVYFLRLEDYPSVPARKFVLLK